MNKQKLLTLINNPHQISQSDLEELQELVDQYPYFQIGHALIAKSKSDNKTLDYRDKIHLAAITTPDRNVLKALIKGKLSPQTAEHAAVETPEPEVEEEQSTEKIEAETPEEPAPEIVAETPEETTPEVTEKIEEKPEIQPDIVSESTEKVEKSIEEPDKEKEEPAIPLGDLNIKASSDVDKAKVNIAAEQEKPEDPKESLYKELEENLKSLQRRKSQPAPKAEATKKTVSETKPAAAKKTTTTAKAKTPASKTTTTKTTAAKSTAAKSTTAKGTAAKSTTTARSTGTTAKKTTASKTTTTKKTTAKPRTTAAKKPSAATKTVSKKTTSKPSTTKSTASAAKKTETSKKKLQKPVNKGETKDTKKKSKHSMAAGSRNKQIEIIEEFIKKEPSIAKPKPVKGGQDTPQEDLSLKSIEIKEDLISENLAIIMEKQGKTQKAKDIYKKLIWKFPQKKAYFASRIEELEKS